ncbi:DEDD exonuclease domain-containing protein [Streptosporangium sp. NBC_01755]|uniref:DEDD exonuclease domain-containing protein n=1 Tax=unclassified Streptosporangium TaxID=2632669 RepID=UPI002DDA6BA0|nr:MULTISPECIES: DEDD exonuclease domain-containing protein [unclassified Streptosporangium]WSA22973.1 DEDD exonuclease domain-containing protein [Streptosporangium sp. NBC_01810]WSC98884.1 DEDD exonuclease domain-containing protein [Streptosporangium sp. NBC_01755]
MNYAVQGTLDELGTPLSQVTFVVFDLETTGVSAGEHAITEIGAVKVRGGEVLGEFGTLVDPGSPIPPFISVLTGITDSMVVAAPRIESVLPSFLEFAAGSTLVAHNAGFDLGFIRAACAAHGYPPPAHQVVDTVDLARKLLTRDEAPNCKLSTLAAIFSHTEPCHRALADARATVDVLHALLERAGSFGVQTLEELKGFVRAPTPEQRRKRHLADSVPTGPGVYVFEDSGGDPLYVGKSTNLRNRVRGYFTASETRPRVREMIGIAARVRSIACATPLEAEVRELRLIGSAKPRYNRRSRHPEKMFWLKLTDELFPRLSVVREVKDDEASYLGPFTSTRAAEDARTALHETIPLRQCTERITPRTRRSACALAEIGRCGAPCEGRETPGEYAVHVVAARRALELDAAGVFSAMEARMERLALDQRYEEAAADRDRLAAYVRTSARMQRLRSLTSISQMVAAAPVASGDWEIHVIRYGRLASAGVMPKGAHPTPFVEALTATAETVPPGPGPVHAASAEETECVLRWLESPGVRLVQVEGTWSLPASGAGRLKARIDRAYQAAEPRRAREGRPLR